MKLTKNTWLPIFSGFYNNNYYNDNEIEYTLFNNPDTLKNEILEFFRQNIWQYIDYEEYRNDIAILLCDYLSNIINDNNITFKYQYISSPKEYNFSNDSINCEVTIINWNIIRKCTNDNIKEFEKYLKDTYTSYDGFWSNYSNNINDWSKLVDNPNNCNEHEIGSILQFYFEINDVVELDLIYHSIENNYISNYINYDKLLKLFNATFDIDYITMVEIEQYNTIDTDLLQKKRYYNNNLSLFEYEG